MLIDRIKEVAKLKNMSLRKFSESIGFNYTTLNGYSTGNRKTIDSSLLEKIASTFEDIDYSWLLTGRGSMLKSDSVVLMGDKESEKSEVLPAKKNLIPFYDDVSTIGGLNDRVVNTDPNSSPTEWIDAGDWFPEATAAIRHYGDSMVEYSSGSILALRRVNDQRLIMNGRNYVIETSEYRVTKQLQDDGDHFMAYSTNRETYPDGRQIHAPFSIPKDAIRYIYLVLGCVTKEYSNGAIQSRK